MLFCLGVQIDFLGSVADADYPRQSRDIKSPQIAGILYIIHCTSVYGDSMYTLICCTVNLNNNASSLFLSSGEFRSSRLSFGPLQREGLLMYENATHHGRRSWLSIRE